MKNPAERSFGWVLYVVQEKDYHFKPNPPLLASYL